jgi:lysophospholipase L1-like esterase
MKKITILILGLLLNTILYGIDSDTIKADNPFIEYTGRIDFSAPLSPRFSYSGVSVRACFQGTSVAFMLNDAGSQNYYNVILNNTVVSRIQTKSGLNTYSIASGLKDTIHEIEIFRLTEETFGKTQFRGFILDKGRTLVEISAKRNHFIEFIGNSITCGYGNEGVNGAGTFGPTTENHYMTYAAIASRSFNARHLAVSKSGIGIYRNYDGPVTGSSDCMTNLYLRTFLYDAAPLYSFKEKPDLVCINLGTNDFSTSKGDPAKYISNYLRFIDTLQLKNQGADILCLLGPMISGNTLTSVRSYLNLIVDSANHKNNGNVYFFEMSQQNGSLGIGIDYHPTVAQHLKNARELISYINTLKAWQVIPQAILGTTRIADEIILNFNTELSDLSGNFSGFSVTADGLPVVVKKAVLNATDKSKLQLTLSTGLLPGQKVAVSYSPGSIQGKDTSRLERIQSLTIQNLLTETKLSKATIDISGRKVTLAFNKNIITPSDLQGILIYDLNNTILAVNSFKPGLTNIEINLDDTLTAGTSYFVTMGSTIFGTDRVAVNPVAGFAIINNSTYTSIVETPVGKLAFYPNPAQNKEVFYIIEGSNTGNITARLFDLQGKLITSEILKGNYGTIDLKKSNIQNGNYILKVRISAKEYSSLIAL